MRDCQNVTVTGCQILNARERGIALAGCSVVRVSDCTIRGRADDKTYRAALSVDKDSRHVVISNNFLARGSDGDLNVPKEIGSASGNVMI